MIHFTLLCPTYIPLHLVVATPIFLLASGIVPLLGLYRIYWFIMYARGPLLGRGVRVQGRVVAPARVEESRAIVFGRTPSGEMWSSPFLVLQGDQEVLVNPEGAILRGWPRRVRVGDTVTVDGFDEAVTLAGDRLYRENVAAPGLGALQVVRGCPPPLSRATRIMAFVWLASFATVLTAFFI